MMSVSVDCLGRGLSRRRRWGMGAFVALFAGLSTAALAEPAQAGYVFGGDAFGSQARVGSTVKSGKTAWSLLGCIVRPGKASTNAVLGVDASPLLRAGAIDTSAVAFEKRGKKGSRSHAVTKNVNLLDGLITADVVRARSTSWRDGRGFHASGRGSRFVGLEIGGRGIGATPAANTRIELPGLGYVVLNERVRSVGRGSARLVVNMLRVKITEQPNSLGLESGARIVVSHAKTLLAGAKGPLGRYAYGSRVKVGDVARSGPTAIRRLPCTGTGGLTRVNELAAVMVPDVLSAALIRNTATGTVGTREAVGKLASRVKKLNLLDGLVEADLVKGVAHARKTASGRSFSTRGSRYLGLRVKGRPGLGTNVARNTRVTLRGIGTLWLKRVIRRPTSIEVRMLELDVLKDNKYGLDIGTNIRIGVAKAAVR